MLDRRAQCISLGHHIFFVCYFSLQLQRFCILSKSEWKLPKQLSWVILQLTLVVKKNLDDCISCVNINHAKPQQNKSKQKWNPLLWRHNEHDSVSNHQPRGCLLNRLFRRRSKKTSKLRVTGLCVGNSPGPVNSPHKGPVTRKMFPFDDVIMPCA